MDFSEPKFMSYHLEKSVLLTFVISLVLAGAFLAMKLRPMDCVEAYVSFKDRKKYYPKDSIEFKLETRSSSVSEIRWHFGDGDIKFSTDRRITHAYRNPGEYIVHAVINGQCELTDTVFIEDPEQELIVEEKPKEEVVEKTPPRQETTSSVRVPNFRYDTYKRVGERVYFSDNTPGATSWRWNINGKIHRERRFHLTFSDPGTKSISLEVAVNGRSYSGYGKVRILNKVEKATKGGPTDPNAPGYDPLTVEMPDEKPIIEDKKEEEKVETREALKRRYEKEIKNMLVKTSANGLYRASDYNKYFCVDDIKVEIQPREWPWDPKFSRFHKFIRGKKYPIISVNVSLNYNEKTGQGCVTWMKIRFTKND